MYGTVKIKKDIPAYRVFYKKYPRMVLFIIPRSCKHICPGWFEPMTTHHIYQTEIGKKKQSVLQVLPAREKRNVHDVTIVVDDWI